MQVLKSSSSTLNFTDAARQFDLWMKKASKFTAALKQLKCRLKIARLQTDCIGRVEAMYLLDTFNVFKNIN